ncbi:hypothetical protein BV898_15894 [Hypsibius exemplaris]|uniref:Uncharacterized protein n=1 Tax=Hypsibius exemplaris TaxID=2072580 RepID=A0A9X6RL66_HYPEX|nr:hypothetical protein BV898_15894 [Hypsibius exemplaris]
MAADHVGLLRAAFQAKGLEFPEALPSFVAESAGGKTGAAARFSVYQAMSFKIQGRGTDTVWFTRADLELHSRDLRRRSVNRRGRGTVNVTLSHLAAVEWAP